MRNQTDNISFYPEPLSNESAIDVCHPDKSNYQSQLNRHAVMHGYGTEHGDEINSLKSVSLRCFITDFVDRYNNMK